MHRGRRNSVLSPELAERIADRFAEAGFRSLYSSVDPWDWERCAHYVVDVRDFGQLPFGWQIDVGDVMKWRAARADDLSARCAVPITWLLMCSTVPVVP